MLFNSENLNFHRKVLGLTQEDDAAISIGHLTSW